MQRADFASHVKPKLKCGINYRQQQQLQWWWVTSKCHSWSHGAPNGYYPSTKNQRLAEHRANDIRINAWTLWTDIYHEQATKRPRTILAETMTPSATTNVLSFSSEISHLKIMPNFFICCPKPHWESLSVPLEQIPGHAYTTWYSHQSIKLSPGCVDIQLYKQELLSGTTVSTAHVSTKLPAAVCRQIPGQICPISRHPIV